MDYHQLILFLILNWTDEIQFQAHKFSFGQMFNLELTTNVLLVHFYLFLFPSLDVKFDRFIEFNLI